ncbi:hypothetical protein [Chitinophaga rhizophila]|uniref:Immunity protein 22 of polymorphic toxin system n=1 Tax=Chitinophaga rhizophila TaxID=2866212 RepID=A0ABS7GIP5_9BACT|nr:hypothetical protein [Chitinophaga rhizophila]MBW8687105.1 hypothetical protein [Chitinophaga rhizophila]
MLRSNDAARFWKWFEVRRDDFRFFREMDQDEIVALFDELTEKLHQYCNSLFFEMRVNEQNEAEMVITANCDEAFFDDAEYLVSQAPVLDRWTFTALIQPDNENGGSIEYGDLELVASEMWYTAVEDPDTPDKLNILVHVQDYELLKENENLDDAVFILLQSLLGERTFASNISVYLVRELPEGEMAEDFPTLDTLPLYIEFLNAQRNTPQDKSS